MIKIVVGIVSKPNDPAREAALARLRVQCEAEGFEVVHVENRPGRFWEWSWRWWRGTLNGAQTRKATHCLLLTDDVVLNSQFGEDLRAAITARPEELVCLHLPHWRFEESPGPWATSDDGCVGPANILPVRVLEDFLQFCREDMHEEADQTWPDDSKMSTFCLATRRKVWHIVPAIISIDESMPSNYGHDGDVYTQPWPCLVQYVDASNTYPYDIGMCYTFYHWSLITHLTPEARRKYRVVERVYELNRTAMNPRLKPNGAATTASSGA